jgi:hypothetical protein
MSQFLRLLM